LSLATVNAVLPAFLIALIGYVAGKKLNLDASSLSRVCLYVLVPALTFNSLSTSKVEFSTVWRLSLATVLMPLALWPIFSLVFAALKWEKSFARAMLLPSLFTNAGNYGLPVCLFAFGTQGMDLGVVFMVTQSVLIASVGVFIAASSNMKPESAFRQVLKMPALYAALAGILSRALRIRIPIAVARPVELLAQAGISVFLLVLGLQLVKGADGASWKASLVVSFLRLIVGPIVTGSIGMLLGLQGLPLKILVLEGAMPPPVNSTILAEEFHAHPQEVSQATMLGTMLSVATLSLWIAVLGRV